MIAYYAVLTGLSAEFGKIPGVYYLLAIAYAGKEKTFVLDFRNDAEDILEAFLPFYRTAKLSGITDKNLVHTLRQKLDAAQIYLWSEVETFARAYFDPKGKQAAIQAPLKQAHERFKAQSKEVQELFRCDLSTYRPPGLFSKTSLNPLI